MNHWLASIDRQVMESVAAWCHQLRLLINEKVNDDNIGRKKFKQTINKCGALMEAKAIPNRCHLNSYIFFRNFLFFFWFLFSNNYKFVYHFVLLVRLNVPNKLPMAIEYWCRAAVASVLPYTGNMDFSSLAYCSIRCSFLRCSVLLWHRSSVVCLLQAMPGR